ncbi:uncharacterized protein LOC135134317 [Zophobas morio]|uniref:uncharacterized protein LOC135134317 n=1 Tax=Zophobas morio TaxID=2755281 RepID=UPI0030834008
MNKAVFVILLRRILFLLVVLKLVNSFILVLQSEECRKYYASHFLMPITYDEKVAAAFHFVVDLTYSIYTSLGFTCVVLGIAEIVGAIFCHTKPVINFAVGISALCIFSAEIIAVVVLKYFVDTFDEAIEQTTTDLFDSVNFVQEEARTRLADYVTSSGEHFVYKDGWSVVGHEDSTNQRYIDFIQTILKCCGLTGRFYWAVPPPVSCCSDEYDHSNCSFAVANFLPCLTRYERFRHLQARLQIQAMVYTLMTLATAIISLYLACTKIKYLKKPSSSDDNQPQYPK